MTGKTLRVLGVCVCVRRASYLHYYGITPSSARGARDAHWTGTNEDASDAVGDAPRVPAMMQVLFGPLVSVAV